MPQDIKKQTKITTGVCIAGGGPAGIMLGYLLARAGIGVTVLEKWPDFFRDFRGDTIHPSTMDILYELGLLEKFLKLPHNENRQIMARIGDREYAVADFSHLKTRCKFIAFIPQWDFLNFIAQEAKQFPCFRLMMETEALDLIRNNNSVMGVKAKRGDELFEIQSELTIGADGRHSTLRQKTNLTVENFGAPIDVLWFKVSRKPNDPPTSLGRADLGHIMFMIDRDDYWQCGFVIKKDSFQNIQAKGLEAFRETILALSPFLKDRIKEIASWDQVKMLSVVVDRLTRWYEDGLLLIGDAAHAMSPIGGVGINLAVQDAVATANILIPKLKSGKISAEDLRAVQERREPATSKTQNLQVFLQDHLVQRVFRSDKPIKLPWTARLILSLPHLNRIAPRVIGVGFQPEHIDPGLF